MVSTRCRATSEQFVALLEFMESHGDLTRPQPGVQGRLKAELLWHEIVDILNSIDGGVKKSLDKWRKVWVDWKAKTKRKVFGLHHASRTGDGVSRITLSNAEQKVLGIMGYSIVDQSGNKKNELDKPSPKRNYVPVRNKESLLSELNIMEVLKNSTACSLSSGEFHGDPLESPTSSVSASVPIPPTKSPPYRQQTAPRRLLRKQRLHYPYKRAASQFITVELRRLQLEEIREKNSHQRELERIRLETKRIEMEESRNTILNRLADITENLVQILPQLRPLQTSSDMFSENT